MTKAYRFSVAPMMNWTDRHCRYFHRLLNPEIELYTEMVTTGALLHNDPARFLAFHEVERPLVLQLGGSEPEALAQCSRMAEEFGYDAVNLNCGCPSERVQKGAFGACLMREPDLVAECIAAMRAATSLPVTIKCRIGIDDSDEYEFLEEFIQKNKAAGCTTFILHARKAWLKGLSPKENRDVPPLNYDRVYKLKQENPDLDIHINGGITTLAQIETHMTQIDGIMIGREAYQNPWFLRQIYQMSLKEDENSEIILPITRHDIAIKMSAYAAAEFDKNPNTKLHDITRHMMGLFKAQRGGKQWRQMLSAIPEQDHRNPNYLLQILEKTPL